jgi:hypothetical protein
MNKRQIIASLNNIANELDFNNLYKEANTITTVMIKLAEDEYTRFPEEIKRTEEDRLLMEPVENKMNFPQNYKRSTEYSENFIKTLNSMLEGIRSSNRKKYVLSLMPRYFNFNTSTRENFESSMIYEEYGDTILEIISFIKQFSKENDISVFELLPIIDMMSEGISE